MNPFKRFFDWFTDLDGMGLGCMFRVFGAILIIGYIIIIIMWLLTK